MSAKFEFDDTRESTGINKLDESERKNLLDQFKSAGGKVLDEKEIREQREAAAAEKAERSVSSGGRRQRGNFGLPDDDERGSSRYASSKDADSASGNRPQSSIAFFFLRLRSMFAGVTQLNGKMVSPSLMHLLAVDLKQALVEFNLLGNDLFLQFPRIGKKINQTLDGQNPLYMELLEKAHQTFQKKDFDSISEAYDSYGNSYVPIDLIFPAFKVIYVKLYVLYSYQNTLKKAFHIAIDTFLEGNEVSTLTNFEEKKKRIEKDINKVFLTIFPKMFMLICVYDKNNYVPFSRSLEKSIGIKVSDQIGKRNRGENSFLSQSDDEENKSTDSSESQGKQEKNVEQENAEQVTEENMLHSKEFEYGIKLMNALNIEALKQECDPKNRLFTLGFNDKAFLSYLFFIEFDHEYSFVLTTNQIKLNIITEPNGMKKDYKRLLSDLYDESRKIHTSIENYHGVRVKLNDLRKNPVTTNYIENSKSLSAAQSRVDIEGRSIRGMVRYYMNNLVISLGELINDMQNAKQIVANANEKLQFNPDIEGKKKMNDKTVESAIVEAYCYALSLKERLEHGDLFGGVLEMTSDEMMKSFGRTFPSP